jgi:LysR family transcriptional regulator for bpeEF and oprC
VARKLGVLPVLTFASPAYLARQGVPHHPDDLHEHVFVNFISPKTGRVFEVDFTGPDGSARSLLAGHRVAANDTDTWLALAVAGMGLIQAPCGTSVRAHVRRGELSVVLPAWRPEGLPIFVMYPRARKLAARVRVFVDWVTELYGQECQLAEQFVQQLCGPAPGATGPGS